MTVNQLSRLQTKILKDLQHGQATADSLAETLRHDPDHVRTALGTLLETQAITAARICDGTLTVYRLAPVPAHHRTL